MPLLIAAAREAGAYGAFLSGAGSTILALTAPERADDVEAGLASRAAELGVAGRTVRTRPTRWGATVAGHWPAGAVLAPMSVEVARGRA
jgi:homoserine kinase